MKRFGNVLVFRQTLAWFTLPLPIAPIVCQYGATANDSHPELLVAVRVVTSIGNARMMIKSPVFRMSVLAAIMAGLVMLNPFGRNLAEPETTGSIPAASVH